MPFSIQFATLADLFRIFEECGRKDHFTKEAMVALFHYYEFGEHVDIDPYMLCDEWNEIPIDDFLDLYPDARPLFSSLPIKKKDNELTGCIDIDQLKQICGVLSIQNGKVLYNRMQTDPTT